MNASNQNNPNPNGMHPQDMRNLVIFLACSILLWLAFDHFVLKPRMEAAKRTAAIAATKTASKTPEEIAATAIRPRAEVLAAGKRITIDAPEIAGTLSTTGSRVDDIELKNYTTTLKGTEPVSIYSPAGTDAPYYAETGWIADSENTAVPDKNSVWEITSRGETLTPETPVTLEWTSPSGLVFTREIAIDKEYMMTITQKVTNNAEGAVTLYPYASVTRKGIPQHSSTTGYEGPIGYIGDELQQVKYQSLVKEPKQDFAADTGWIGMSEKYWFSSVIPEQGKKTSFRFTAVPEEPKEKSLFQVDARSDAVTIEKGQTGQSVTHLFVGAKKTSVLDAYEADLGIKKFSLAVDFGMLYFLTRPLYFFLTLFNSWVGNFGLATIMLTILVRLAVFPLASASYRSFAKMKKVAPQMAELRIKYASDKPKLQQELIKLYETERVNPMAGCFPLILQIPIFFAVYKVISISIEMRHAPFFGWIHDLSERDPLSVFNLFGLLPYEVPTVLHIGPWSIIMLIVMLIQQRLNPPPTDVIQKDMMRFMPWVVTYTLSRFPSGLVLYWTFSNLFSLIQQAAIMKSMGVPIYIFEKDEALAHAADQQTRVQAVVEKAKIDKEYLKHRIEEVDVVDVEEALFDAVEGKDHEKKKDDSDK